MDDESLINTALGEIYDNDEVSEPTKKKVRRRLQSKLCASKKFMTAHKQLIHSLIAKYWITPPNVEHSGHVHILSLPDHIQQYCFTMLHPKSLFIALPAVCKWWHHLLHQSSFLHSLCVNVMQMDMQRVPSVSVLRLSHIIPFIRHSCVQCARYDSSITLSSRQWAPVICWVHPLCSTCYDTHTSLQGISWLHARQTYKLDDYDLHCCRAQMLGKTYLLHSDVLNVAMNKYGDINRIHELTPLDIAAVNNQRRRCYQHKIKALRKELKQWLLNTQLTANDDDNAANEIQLSVSDIKTELNAFLAKHGDGYGLFSGTHSQAIVDNFDRKHMDLTAPKDDVRNLLRDHIEAVKQRKQRIKQMTKNELYADLYTQTWMNDRFS